MSSHIVTAIAWPWAVVSAIFVLLAGAAIQRSRKHTHSRLPPGPSPLPLLGNILDFPRKHLGREFAALAKTYGDVMYLSLLGRDVVVLGSLTAARDLLDKRSANYSDRPTLVMAELVDFGWLTALMNYGPRWRAHRRAMHLAMAPETALQYAGTQADAAHRFVADLLREPQDLAAYIKRAVTATTIGAIYGISDSAREDSEDEDGSERYHKVLERMAEVGEAILLPGNFAVEAFPVLRHLPAWFPGGAFKRWAEEARRDIAYGVDYLFAGAKAATGDSATRSVVARILQHSESQEDSTLPGTGHDVEKMCKEVAATLYFGAADALTVEMEAFFMAMTLYPEAQKRAQQELDTVVGTARLPEWADRSSLPYINALVKELLRWHPPTPLGLVHRAVAEDEYNGYRIPGGATVFVNMWAILRDPEVYHRPDDFVPERFLDSAGNLNVHGRDPAEVMFGFGRRVCPGQHFAEYTMFMLCASILCAFEIGPPVGEDGAPMEVQWEATDHLVVSHTRVHEYSIKPRSPHIGQLVEMVLAQ